MRLALALGLAGFFGRWARLIVFDEIVGKGRCRRKERASTYQVSSAANHC